MRSLLKSIQASTHTNMSWKLNLACGGMASPIHVAQLHARVLVSGFTVCCVLQQSICWQLKFLIIDLQSSHAGEFLISCFFLQLLVGPKQHPWIRECVCGCVRQHAPSLEADAE